jgi:hypothetical protein
MSHRRVVARMEARASGLTGLDALRLIMLEALPLDEERDLEARIEISFWGRALGRRPPDAPGGPRRRPRPEAGKAAQARRVRLRGGHSRTSCDAYAARA